MPIQHKARKPVKVEGYWVVQESEPPYQQRYRLTLNLNRSILQLLWKYPASSLFPKAAVPAKIMSEWDFLLTNRIKMGWGWFVPMYVSRFFPVAKDGVGETRWCDTAEHVNSEHVRLAMIRFWENSASPSRPRRYFWTLSRQYWSVAFQIC